MQMRLFGDVEVAVECVQMRYGEMPILIISIGSSRGKERVEGRKREREVGNYKRSSRVLPLNRTYMHNMDGVKLLILHIPAVALPNMYTHFNKCDWLDIHSVQIQICIIYNSTVNRNSLTLSLPKLGVYRLRVNTRMSNLVVKKTNFTK
jgi:hypothetical protein